MNGSTELLCEIEQLGEGYTSLEDFFDDNPGAVEAVRGFIEKYFPTDS